MSRITKRILSLPMVLCLIFTLCVPVTAAAAGTGSFNGNSYSTANTTYVSNAARSTSIVLSSAANTSDDSYSAARTFDRSYSAANTTESPYEAATAASGIFEEHVQMPLIPEKSADTASLFEGEDPAAVEALRSYFHDQIWAGTAEIVVDSRDYGNLSYETITAILGSLYYEPDMFLYEGGYLVSLGNNHYTFCPDYRQNILAEYDDAKALYTREIDAIVQKVQSDWSDLEKVLFLNDYVASHYTYYYLENGQPGNIYDAYQMLKYGTGVCQAYSLLMMALLRSCSIECSYVSSNSLNHMWNMVKVDGKWYHLDVTWDDPGTTLGYAGHDFFLLSADAIRTVENGAHYKDNDWVYGDSSVTDESFSAATYDYYFWSDACSPFVPDPNRNNVWYYLSSKGLNSWDGVSDNYTCLFSLAEVYQQELPEYIWDQNRSYVYMSGIDLVSGNLYFASYYLLFRYNLADGNYTILYNLYTGNSFDGTFSGSAVDLAKQHILFQLYGDDVIYYIEHDFEITIPDTGDNGDEDTGNSDDSDGNNGNNGNEDGDDSDNGDGDTAPVLSADLDGGTLYYRISNPAPQNARLFVAEYDSAGRMLACTYVAAPTTSGSVNVNPADSYRVFLADGITYVPLCNCAVIRGEL